MTTDFDEAWRIGAAFFSSVVDGDDPERTRRVVTPESSSQWGDFSAVRELFEGATLTSQAEYPAPNVAYVKIVSEEIEGLAGAGGGTPIMARAVITLVHHPEAGWLVHQVGEYGLPENMPHYT